MHMRKKATHAALCTFISQHFPSANAVFVGAVISARWPRRHAADGGTVSFSCTATGRFKWTDWQCCAGRGWETLSHYERVPAQCSALLKKYTKSHMLETLHSCSCFVSPASRDLIKTHWNHAAQARVMTVTLIPVRKSHLVSKLVSIHNTVMVASMAKLYSTYQS